MSELNYYVELADLINVLNKTKTIHKNLVDFHEKGGILEGVGSIVQNQRECIKLYQDQVIAAAHKKEMAETDLDDDTKEDEVTEKKIQLLVLFRKIGKALREHYPEHFEGE